MNKKQIVLVIVAIVLVSTWLGVAIQQSIEQEEAEAGKVKVVASFYPHGYFANRIGGKYVYVETIIPDNTELHGFQPSVSDIVEADDADILIYSGTGIDAWVEDDLLPAISTSNKDIIKTSEGLELLENVDPVVEAGHHLFEDGPFEAISAGPNESAAADIEDGVCYNLTLHDENGTYVGYLTFEPEEEGEFAIFLEHDEEEMGFFVSLGNETVEPEEHEHEEHEHEEHEHEDPFEWHGVYDLEGNTTYMIHFNTTEEELVKLGIAHLHEHDDHDNGHDDGHDDGHDHGPNDPHTWISPFTAVQEAEAIYDALVEEDPDHEAYYTDRWETLRDELEELDHAYMHNLSDAPVSGIIVLHSAFGYLSSRYEFEQHGLIEGWAEEEPSTSDIIELAELMEDEEIYSIFVDPVYPTNFAETLETEVEEQTGENVNVLRIYLMTGRIDGMDYIEQMEKNLDNLKIGLGVV